ncbi:MAG: diphthamide biosynthesis enzyme Dph2 [Sulfolobales archaeon]
MNELSKSYIYDSTKVFEEILRRNPKKVLIQLPEGLKHYSINLTDELVKTFKNVEFTVDANPIYGSCILNNHINTYYDLVLHFGHEPYPYMKSINEKVVFVDLLSNLTPNEELLKTLTETLKTLNTRNTAIYTTHQHKKTTEKVRKYLENHGIKTLNRTENPTIMGCWFNDVLNHLNTSDNYIVVASGLFHPLGIGLLTKGLKPVIQLDLYRNEVKVLNETINKYLRIRYSKIMNSIDTKTWLLIHGIEGQFRNNIREELIKALKSKKINYYEYQSSIINQEVLRNIDNVNADVYVITACPRLPIDDLQDFEKPVLTPGEAFMILKELKDYTFPW